MTPCCAATTGATSGGGGAEVVVVVVAGLKGKHCHQGKLASGKPVEGSIGTEGMPDGPQMAGRCVVVVVVVVVVVSGSEGL
jgi:hypothetical protein